MPPPDSRTASERRRNSYTSSTDVSGPHVRYRTTSASCAHRSKIAGPSSIVGAIDRIPHDIPRSEQPAICDRYDPLIRQAALLHDTARCGVVGDCDRDEAVETPVVERPLNDSTSAFRRIAPAPKRRK